MAIINIHLQIPSLLRMGELNYEEMVNRYLFAYHSSREHTYEHSA